MKSDVLASLIQRLEKISQSSNPQPLIEQFRIDFPDNLDWLGILETSTHAEPVNASKPGSFPELENFKIINVLGSGANGKVYLAQNKSDWHFYAIKVPLHFPDENQIQRFRHEIKLLSSLTHPHIAQILESGVLSGNELPYIVMEYVKGENILEYCRNKRFSLHQIVELFIQVLDAVQYAHTKGIVHRDIKPDNVLVTETGDVKLLDFGIALATENSTQQLTQLTQTGQIVGTLAYMSPEQVSGQDNIDTRADVYSLGVVLYQLLSGALPFKIDPGQIFTAISKILEDLPARISNFNKNIDSDLATIVHHALEKKADNRYQSPRELKLDLQRWQSGDTVGVKHHSLWYLIKHISRKHKALVSGSILAVLGLITGLIFAVSFAIREQQARKIAETNAKTNQETVEFINQIFTSADPDNIYGDELTVLQLIDSAERTLDSQLQGESEVEANIRTTLAGVYTGLNKLDKAQSQVDKVNKLLKKIEHISSYHDFYFAINFIQAKINLARSNTKENIVLLKQLIKESADYPVDKHKAQVALSNTYLLDGDVDNARELLERIQNPPATAEFPENHVSRLFAQNSYAMLFEKTGDFTRSRDLYQQNLQSHIELYGENHIQTLIVMNNLATVEQKLGHSEKALEMFQKVIEGKTKVLGPHHLSTLISEANLLSVYITSGQLEKADDYSKRLLEDLQENAGELHPRTLDVKNMRAYLLEDMGKLVESEALYRSTLKIYRENGISKGPELFSLQNNLAMLLMKQSQLQESGRIFEELLNNVEEYLGKDHIYYAIFIGNYGELLTQMKKYNKARPLLEESYVRISKTFGENHQRTLKAKKRLEQLPQSD